MEFVISLQTNDTYDRRVSTISAKILAQNGIQQNGTKDVVIPHTELDVVLMADDTSSETSDIKAPA